MNVSSSRIPLNPRSEYVETVALFWNASDQPVEIKGVEPADPQGGGVAEIVSLELVVRNAGFGAGWFRTYPPAGRVKGKCVVDDLRAPEGYVLRPGAEARILVWLRTGDGAGRFKFPGWIVSYGSGDELFVPYTIKGEVTASPQPERWFDLQCAHVARVLPGYKR